MNAFQLPQYTFGNLQPGMSLMGQQHQRPTMGYTPPSPMMPNPMQQQPQEKKNPLMDAAGLAGAIANREKPANPLDSGMAENPMASQIWQQGQQQGMSFGDITKAAADQGRMNNFLNPQGVDVNPYLKRMGLFGGGMGGGFGGLFS